MTKQSGDRTIFNKLKTILFCFSFLLSGCQNEATTYSPVPASSITPTYTTLPVISETPTPVSVFSIVNVDDLFPSGIFQFSQDFSSIGNGLYMLLYGHDGFIYYSIEDTEWGLIGDFVDTGFYDLDYDLENNLEGYVSDSSITSNFNDPEYMSVSAVRNKLEGTNSYFISEMQILSFRFGTGEQHVWRVTFHPESGILCQSVSLSPDHTQIAGNCKSGEENQIYLFDIRDATSKIFKPADNLCADSEDNSYYWTIFNWSPNSEWLSATCHDGNNYYSTCFLSLITGDFSCPNPGFITRIYAWSPSGNKVATDGDEGIVVVDWICIVQSSDCQVNYSIPWTGVLNGFAWDWSGEKIAWAMYPMDYVNPGDTTIAIANIETGETIQIQGPIGGGPGIGSFSPTGDWIAFNDGEAIISVDSQIIRPLPSNLGVFMGWLIIP